jgi:hypothetical protein
MTSGLRRTVSSPEISFFEAGGAAADNSPSLCLHKQQKN